MGSEKRKGRWWLLAGLLVLGIVIWQGLWLYRLWQAVQAVQQDVDDLQALAKTAAAEDEQGSDLNNTVSAGLALFEQTHSDIHALDKAARPYLWAAPLLGWVPVYGGDIQAAPHLLEMATELVNAVKPWLDALAPVVEQNKLPALSPEAIFGPGLRQIVNESAAALNALETPEQGHSPQSVLWRESVERALSAHAQIDVERLSPRFSGLVTKLDPLMPLLAASPSALKAAPDLLDVGGALLGDIEALKMTAQEGLDADQLLALFQVTYHDAAHLLAAFEPLQSVLSAGQPALSSQLTPGDISAVFALLDVTGDVLDALNPVAIRLIPLVEEKDLNTLVPEFSAVVEDLDAELLLLRHTLVDAEKTISAATAESALLQKALVKSDAAGKLVQALHLAGPAIDGLGILSDMLGADEPRTYLLLIQNEEELRATGGLISGVARFTLDRGKVLDLVFEDSYKIDNFRHPYPDAPAPFLTYMLAEIMVLRDSNWSPDFPTSAQTAIEVYNISRTADLDGVIVVDQEAVRRLIDALGSVQVPGQKVPITGENVIQIARQMYNPTVELVPGKEKDKWWLGRKDIMGMVLSAALSQIETDLSPDTLIDLGQAAMAAINEKHMLVYMLDENAKPVLAELGWDGSIRQDPGDYLMVVDTNLGFNKANGVVRQELSYAVNLQNVTAPQVALTVHHIHPVASDSAVCLHEPRYDPTYDQMMERCYWNYMRVYVPASSELVEATPHAVSGADLLSGQPSPAEVWAGEPVRGRDEFSTFMLLRKGETLDTRFVWNKPELDLEQMPVPEQTWMCQEHTPSEGGKVLRYTLTLQKQPGTHAVPVDVQVALPDGAQLVEVCVPLDQGESETPWTFQDGMFRVELTLEQDRVISITFQ